MRSTLRRFPVTLVASLTLAAGVVATVGQAGTRPAGADGPAQVPHIACAPGVPGVTRESAFGTTTPGTPTPAAAVTAFLTANHVPLPDRFVAGPSTAAAATFASTGIDGRVTATAVARQTGTGWHVTDFTACADLLTAAVPTTGGAS